MIAWLFCILLLASCSSRSDWNVSYLSTGSEEFNAAKLTMHTKDRVHGMDVEFVHTELGVRTYLLVHSHPVPPQVVVSVQTDHETLQFAAIRREGGQRILLPLPLQELLLSSLKQGKSVTLELPGYRTTLSPAGFEKEFEKMENPPFNLPLKLPF